MEIEDSAERRETGPAAGLFDSARNLFASVVTIVQTRLDLLTIEVQEEVQRAAVLLIWAFIGLLSGLMALLLGAFTVIFAFWETYRVAAALSVTGFFLIIAVAAILVLTSKIRSKPRILDATRSELEQDRDRLRSKL
jgi:uncharacterized membrane protein YqjE